jgi:hypothetical protein
VSFARRSAFLNKEGSYERATPSLRALKPALSSSITSESLHRLPTCSGGRVRFLEGVPVSFLGMFIHHHKLLWSTALSLMTSWGGVSGPLGTHLYSILDMNFRENPF